MDTQPHLPLAEPLLSICFPFLGRTFGGSHRATLLLAAALPPGVTPRFVVHEHGPVTEQLAAAGIAFDMVPLPPLAGSDRSRVPLLAHVARAAPALRAYLKRTGTGLVHCNDGRMNVTWGPAARLAGVPFVWHQHSQYVPSRFANLFLHLADAIIGVSNYSLEDLPQRARRRAHVIANPFEVDVAVPERGEARRQFLERHSLPHDAVIVAFVGNLTQQKRPMVFVNAIERLRKENARVVGVLFGEPREPLAGAVRRSDAVRLLGFQFPLEPALAACDVLLAPAVEEGFGRSLVEAMLVGTPVVAAASGGQRDIVRDRDNGRLVPPDDDAALAAAAHEILNASGTTLEMTARARASARATYSTAAHTASVVAVYRALTIRRRRAA